ncbi:hypothetical protein FLJC2902T_15270 [Flavobacterium limnosediminis JC2902]|uniref:Fibronectin type-III domain-containing protein n=1 Tax=Flavobacterium limnosediminis JC2902 TaxID=1341181 RepID=V6SPQ3_9FLAO|nr:T9SS type A sorting domain-containing protein [Flavobacterium limnosediminis]ESU28182.1 hypothetical protein FLJC2902T_15270 [Flavobacterium limnosediminis JC2902]
MKKKLLLITLLFIGSVSLFAQGTTTCAAAYTLTTNGQYSTGAITGTYPATSCYAAPNPSAAMWFKFTPTQSGLITVNADIAANPANADTRMSIFTGTCSTLTCVAGNDDVSASNYRSKVENFAVTAGTTYYIVWDNKWESVTRFFDFTFTAQTCFVPTNFTYTAAPTTTTAGIGWTAPTAGTPTGYQFEYGVRGFTQGTGTTVNTNAATTSVSLTSLTPGTVYSFYVRTNCGSGNYSVWAGPVNFNTVFPAVNPTYNTSFEDTAFNFIGWADPAPVSGGAWSFNAAGVGNPTVQNGATSVFSSSVTTGPTNSSVISRGINLVAGQQATISFYALNYRATGNTTSTSSFEVRHGSAQTVVSQTNLIGSETAFSGSAFVLKTYTFTPSTTGVYYFSIKHTSPANAGGAAHALIIDNFTVTQTLSTDDFISSKLSVYPNPVNNVVNISNAENLQINTVVINDINGRTVKTVNVNGVAETQINVSDLNSGIYFMNIETNEGTATKKIIKN